MRKAIRVGLVYKNLDDQAWPVGVSLDITAYQDGLSLPFGSTWYIEEPTAEDEAYGEDVEPGETVKCNALFVLRNDSPVEIVIEEIPPKTVKCPKLRKIPLVRGIFGFKLLRGQKNLSLQGIYYI